MALLRSLLFSRRLLLPSRSSYALISTSKKTKDTLIFPEDAIPKRAPPGPKTAEDFADVKNQKNWVSYGYDEEDYEMDEHLRKLCSFLFLTVIVCGGTFIFAYGENWHNNDWAMREAYLELHRREKNGLPLVDRNLIDPALVQLPSDEELGETEIIL